LNNTRKKVNRHTPKHGIKKKTAELSLPPSMNIDLLSPRESSSTKQLSRKSTSKQKSASYTHSILSKSTFGDLNLNELNKQLKYDPHLLSDNALPSFHKMGIELSNSSYCRLKKNPAMATDANSLYFSDQIIDLSTQWYHRGLNIQDGYVPTSSFFSETLRLNKDSCNERDLEDALSSRYEVLNQNCLDITIHANNHFSKVFVMNPYIWRYCGGQERMDVHGT